MHMCQHAHGGLSFIKQNKTKRLWLLVWGVVDKQSFQNQIPNLLMALFKQE